MSRNGHATSDCALATGCGSFCVAPEKKLAILSFRDGVVAAAAAGGTAPVDAVVVGAPTPPPHPASNANASKAPTGERWRPDLGDRRCVPHVIGNSRSLNCYSKIMA